MRIQQSDLYFRSQESDIYDSTRYQEYDYRSSEYCDKTSESQTITFNENNEKEKLKCDHCDRLFKSEKMLHYHNSIIHEGIKHKCNVCDQSFVQLKRLESHIKYAQLKENEENNSENFNMEENSYENERNFENPNSSSSEAIFARIINGDISEDFNIENQRNFEEIDEHCEDFDTKSNELEVETKSEESDLKKEFKKYKCSKCGEKFVTNRQIQEHIITVHDLPKPKEPKIYKCKCSRGKKFATLENLNNHIKKFHEGTKNYKCDECGKAFVQERSLISHMKIVHLRLNNPDSISDSIFKRIIDGYNSENFNIENKKKFEENDENCDDLNKESIEIEKFVRNLLIDLIKNKVVLEQYTCDKCGDEFVKFCQVQDHIKNVHKLPKFEAPKNHFCEKMREKQGRMRKCGKKFVSLENLNNHIKNFHEGTKNYKCDQCDKTFVQEISLKSHMDFVHLKQKDLICKNCEKWFGKIENLEKHIVIVHGKFKCETCGKAFAHPESLELHMTKFHPENLFWMNIKCETCGKHFALEETLKQHKITAH